MLMYEIINKKKHGLELLTDEIKNVVDGFTGGKIPNYQMSALLMAIYFMGMTTREISDLTMAMAASGDVMDLSSLGKKTVDKHSTGGVGDKTTLIVAPIIAALGLPVAKMSGRGLGHTGGTIDKLESIPGFRTELSTAEFLQNVKKHGLCVAGQSGNLVPADKKIYALRDVTATVDSIPLIAASIMSKKIAAGAKHILLDVKMGSGAFMKDINGARKLAEAMVNIGKNCGRKTAALITDMSAPLGRAIGNNLEIKEVIQILTCHEHSPRDLVEVCVELAANILFLVEQNNLSDCKIRVEEALNSGAALKKFVEMVESQGGDSSYIENPDKFENAKYVKHVKANQKGYVNKIDTEGLGIAAMLLGAGREKPEDKICYSSGIVLRAGRKNYVEVGQVLASLYTNDESAFMEAENKFISSLEFSRELPEEIPLVHARVGL